jgi:hypothetical protein
MPTSRSILVELTMATPVTDRAEIAPAGFAAISRAVVAAAAELVGTVERAVIGDANVRTARGNAWDAICADRARAQARDEMDQLVRTLLAAGTRATVAPDPSAAPAASRAIQAGSAAAQTGSAAAQAGSAAALASSRAAQRAAQPAAERTAQASTRASRTRPASQNRADGQQQPAAKSRRGGKTQRAVGSSPRSKASQTARVSTGSTTR